MKAAAAALTLFVSAFATSAWAQAPGCPENGVFPSEAWSAQSRHALASRLRFPPGAAQEGVAGVARLQIDVDREGRIHGLSIATSSGNPMLDQAALDAARGIGRFAPLPCLPTPRIRVIIPVQFALGH